MLPFFDPMDARVYYSQQGMEDDDVKAIHTINDAMTLVLADIEKLFDPAKKHILISHFAVSPSKDQEIELTSETTSKVGGLATLTASQFNKFDYVMLGHIHTRFASPSDTIRYSGSPVKFNVKEARIKNKGKGVDIVEISDDKITRKYKEITPKTDLIVLEETWNTLMEPNFYENQPLNKAWFAITIKEFDRSRHLNTNVRAQLQNIYGTVVELDYQAVDSKESALTATKHANEMSPEETVGQFFKSITNKDLTTNQKNIVENIFVELRKEK